MKSRDERISYMSHVRFFFFTISSRISGARLDFSTTVRRNLDVRSVHNFLQRLMLPATYQLKDPAESNRDEIQMNMNADLNELLFDLDHAILSLYNL